MRCATHQAVRVSQVTVATLEPDEQSDDVNTSNTPVVPDDAARFTTVERAKSTDFMSTIGRYFDTVEEQRAGKESDFMSTILYNSPF